MNKTQEVIIAGFGGQGVMFAGRLMTVAGMHAGKEVSWLPSYGPEMRGGTANCHVVISENPVGSPIVVNPTTLIAMNRPSLEKFEDSILPGGLLLMDSSLIDIKPNRTDIKLVGMPATQLANDMGVGQLANMILVGKWIRETGILTLDMVKTALNDVVSARKQDLIEVNIKALELGYTSDF